MSRTDALQAVSVWALISLVFSLAWELAQLPLYAIPSARTIAQVAYAVAHCTGGDVLIAVVSFLLAAAAVRDVDWPASRPWHGGAVAVVAGVSYTAYSEWYNVYQAGSWAYLAHMPLVYGIGVSPLLQWIVVPLVTTLVVRRRAEASSDSGPRACLKCSCKENDPWMPADDSARSL